MASDMEAATCSWSSDEDGIYHTACGHEFTFESDPPHDWMKFCCYCAASVAFKEYEPIYEDEDD